MELESAKMEILNIYLFNLKDLKPSEDGIGNSENINNGINANGGHNENGFHKQKHLEIINLF